MTDQITQGLRKFQLDAKATVKDLYEALNRELIPIIDRMRGTINRRFGALVEVTADYTMRSKTPAADEFVFCSSGSDITLPDAAERRWCFVVNTATSGNLDVSPIAGQEISGDAVGQAIEPEKAVMFVSDGSNWYAVCCFSEAA